MPTNIRQLEEFRPDYITGYASSLEAFGREQAENRMNLTELGCLKQITNVAEPLSDKSAAWLEQVFGAHVTDEYAMGECMALSSGCTMGRGAHINSDLAILEVVDENDQPVPPGTEGSKVLLTNLYNRVQPIIRYEIDDRVTMSAKPCACGSFLPHIERISGRSKDKLFIETEDGQRRELPYYLILTGLHHVLEMAEHQIVQTGPRHFLIRAVPVAGQKLDVERIRSVVMEQVVSEDLDRLIEVEIAVVPELPRGPSGKISRALNEYAKKKDASPPDIGPDAGRERAARAHAA
jgi:phenylacetate-coenzyme A ligase PaaK-like adenylate-forming protein